MNTTLYFDQHLASFWHSNLQSIAPWVGDFSPAKWLVLAAVLVVGWLIILMLLSTARGQSQQDFRMCSALTLVGMLLIASVFGAALGALLVLYALVRTAFARPVEG